MTISHKKSAASRQNAAKARTAESRLPHLRAALRGSEKAKKASHMNAARATSTRTARAILKALPPGAAPGTTFTACQTRHITVIDPAPHKDGSRWIQTFRQRQTVTAAGERFTRSGIIRIVWTEEPTLDKILSAPTLETE